MTDSIHVTIVCFLQAFAHRITRANSALNLWLANWRDGCCPLNIKSFCAIQMVQHIRMMISMKNSLVTELWSSGEYHTEPVGGLKDGSNSNTPKQRGTWGIDVLMFLQLAGCKAHNYMMAALCFSSLKCFVCSNGPSTVAKRRFCVF
jgi:hypothetical protein